MMRRFVLMAMCVLWAGSGRAQAEEPSPTPVRIGVAAIRGTEETKKSWQPTAAYLTAALPAYRFEIRPLEMDQIIPAIQAKEIDFLATNPVNYVELEMRHGVSDIATLVSLRNSHPLTSYAGVIIARADRADIQSLGDLKGKTFLGYDEASLGGWWMAWRELKGQGVDPYHDLKSLNFTKTSQDEVAYGVRDRKADAGCLRSDVFEQLIAKGTIRHGDFKILNLQPTTREYPYPRSTRLYPEWPMAVLKHVSRDLAREVAVSLLHMPKDCEAARAAQCAGWTVSMNYGPIHECMRELQVGPYKSRAGETVNFLQVVRENWPKALAVTALLLVVPLAYVMKTNRKLKVAHDQVTTELTRRERAQEYLRESEERYRLLVESVQDYAIYTLDPAGNITSWNKGAQAIKGYSASEIIGKSFECFYTSEDLGQDKPRRELAAAASRGRFEEEGWRIGKGGKQIWCSVVLTAMRDENGNLKGFSKVTRDITARKQAETQLIAYNRALRVISECNEALVRSNSETELLDDICRLIVEVGGYSMAWVGYAEDDAQKTIRPVAYADHDGDFLKGLPLTWADTPQGQGPVGTAIRTGKPALSRDLATDPAFAPWREEAAKRNYVSTISMPLFTDGHSFGALSLYSGLSGGFDYGEVDLLMQLASDLAYGVMSLRTRALRDKAEEELRLDESRLETLLKLGEMAEAPLQEVTDFAMEQGVRLTKSTIGYLAFMNDDETVLTMHSWSKNAMAQCSIIDKPILYPVVNTGLWGECVRQRKPIITNEYEASNPLKKGYPQGHVPVKRHMNIPVFDGQRIVAVAGVGNKKDLYIESDVRQLQLLMDGMWKLIQRKRADEAIRQLNEELEQRVLDRTRQLEQAVHSERDAHESLKKAQAQMIQSEKLASLGQLVAGIAHEVNNPLSFIMNNYVVLQRDITAVTQLVELYRRADALLAREEADLHASIHALCERVDMDYTVHNLQDLLSRSREGLQRIQQIVLGLRDFARIEESQPRPVDINAGIESTITIVLGQAKKRNVQIRKELQAMPAVPCYPAKVNQVIMNLLTNAIGACREGGEVIVRTRVEGPAVQIEVEDNGHGIEPEVRPKIFDPFFTTKPQGEGMGLGLSISYGIVKDHGGAIEVKSAPGRGARFIVTLPLVGNPGGPRGAA